MRLLYSFHIRETFITMIEYSMSMFTQLLGPPVLSVLLKDTTSRQQRDLNHWPLSHESELYQLSYIASSYA